MGAHHDGVAAEDACAFGKRLGDRADQDFLFVRQPRAFKDRLGTREHAFALLALQLLHLLAGHVDRDLAVDQRLFVRVRAMDRAIRDTPGQGQCMIEARS